MYAHACAALRCSSAPAKDGGCTAATRTGVRRACLGLTVILASGHPLRPLRGSLESASGRMIRRVRALEGGDFHAAIEDAEHAGEVGEVDLEPLRIDHLGHQEDVRDGGRIAVAELTSLAFAQRRLQRAESFPDPVAVPAVARLVG